MSFFLSQRIDWVVWRLTFRVQRTASFFTLMLGIRCSVFILIVIPIQFSIVVSTF